MGKGLFENGGLGLNLQRCSGLISKRLFYLTHLKTHNVLIPPPLQYQLDQFHLIVVINDIDMIDTKYLI